jgi:hypothetical protein
MSFRLMQVKKGDCGYSRSIPIKTASEKPGGRGTTACAWGEECSRFMCAIAQCQLSAFDVTSVRGPHKVSPDGKAAGRPCSAIRRQFQETGEMSSADCPLFLDDHRRADCTVI